jgi:hypothetical protein
MVGFVFPDMKSIGQKLSHGNARMTSGLLSVIVLLQSIIRNLRMPTHLTCWKKENIMKSRIEGMDLRDALKGASSTMKNDIATI